MTEWCVDRARAPWSDTPVMSENERNLRLRRDHRAARPNGSGCNRLSIAARTPPTASSHNPLKPQCDHHKSRDGRNEIRADQRQRQSGVAVVIRFHPLEHGMTFTARTVLRATLRIHRATFRVERCDCRSDRLWIRRYRIGGCPTSLLPRGVSLISLVHRPNGLRTEPGQDLVPVPDCNSTS